MGVNSLPKTVTRQCRGCDLNAGPTAPESSTLTLGYGATSMGQRKSSCYSNDIDNPQHRRHRDRDQQTDIRAHNHTTRRLKTSVPINRNSQ